jgi:hypothetical protein
MLKYGQLSMQKKTQLPLQLTLKNPAMCPKIQAIFSANPCNLLFTTRKVCRGYRYLTFETISF